MALRKLARVEKIIDKEREHRIDYEVIVVAGLLFAGLNAHFSEKY